jgi:hypothetical protein
MKITPLIKGAITGLLMAVVSFVMVTNKTPSDYGVYLIYAIYIGGIAWTLYDHYRSPGYTGKFGAIFGEGFRCFIIVTLVMVVYTFIFLNMHPEIAEESAKLYKADLIQQKNKTPAEVEDMYAKAKDGFTTSNIYLTIFSTLITGAFFTAAGAGLLIMRRK